MSTAGVQEVLTDLISDQSAEQNFRNDPDKYLADFDLTDQERAILKNLDVDALQETAEFLNNFSDTEASIGSVWIKDAN